MKKPRKLLAAVALTAVLAAIYCNFSLETEDWTVSSPRLPEAFSGLRVLLLTDLVKFMMVQFLYLKEQTHY